MSRFNGKFGRPYNYTPRAHLMTRLSEDLNLTPEEVLEQIAKERDALRLALF